MFEHFLAIDWSGAKGERQKGIAVALAHAAGGPPILVHHHWSRDDVLAILRDDLPCSTLVGLDLGIALPFVDCGAYFPDMELAEKLPDAPSLWRFVDIFCEHEACLGVSNFVDHPYFSTYFRHPAKGEGSRFRCDGATHGRGRFRVTEQAQAAMGCKPYSNFNLVGAAQVGKSSLTGMRMLHHLRGHLPVWPIDPLPNHGSGIVEIYTSLAALDAGRNVTATKMRSYEALNQALAVLGSPPVPGEGVIDDHSSDALLTVAWLRIMAKDPSRWVPHGLTPEIARTEGWTFGAI